MNLTQLAVKNAKPKEKPYKLGDGAGLYLLIKPGGGKYWRFKYSYAGKEKLLALGVYPAVSLLQAREKRDTAKKLLSEGVDPAAGETSDFETAAVHWWKINKPRWDPAHANTIKKRLENHLFPELKDDVRDITPKQILEAVRKVEKAGKGETARRLLGYTEDIFQLCVIEGRLKYNVASGLEKGLMPFKSTPMRTIGVDDIPELVEAIDLSGGNRVVKLATLITMHCFPRNSELRGGEWPELDTVKALWTIPAERMKMKEAHIIPCSRQVLGYFRELRQINGNKPYMFAALNKFKHKHPIISENAINNFLQDIGFGERLVGHGFRALASTALNEILEFPPDVIERQLAHRERNAVRAAYNRATYLEQRKVMMQAWSDYIDSLG